MRFFRVPSIQQPGLLGVLMVGVTGLGGRAEKSGPGSAGPWPRPGRRAICKQAGSFTSVVLGEIFDASSEGLPEARLAPAPIPHGSNGSNPAVAARARNWPGAACVGARFGFEETARLHSSMETRPCSARRHRALLPIFIDQLSDSIRETDTRLPVGHGRIDIARHCQIHH